VEALETCENFLAIHPGHFDATLLAGTAKIVLGDPGGALTLLATAVRLRPQSCEALLNYGVALHHTGDHAGALAQCESALALGADTPEAHNIRGNALRALGRPEEALASYERVLTLKIDDADAWSNRGAVLLDFGHPEEALQSCTQAIALRCDFAEAMFNRANVLGALGRHHRALADYDEAVRCQPGYRAALANKVAILIMLGRHEAALAAARQATARDPSHVDALVDCAIAVGRSGHIAETLAAYAEALKIAPAHVAALRHCGAASQEVDEPAQALATFKKLLKVRPADADAFCQRGRALLALGRHTEALASFDQALAVERSHALALGSAGFAALHLCDWRRAERIARTIEWGVAGHGMEVPPIVLLSLSDLPQVQQAGAENFAATIEAPPLPRRPPLAEQPFVTEKIVHLPDCYWVRGTTRTIAQDAPDRASDQVPDREAAGLSAGGFVFCSFNDVFKIARPVFEAWMRLLAHQGGSVLWLRHDNDIACQCLRREAAARGIDPSRLVFAGPAAPAEHLARHRAADLFLDTLPYGGHATVADALSAGLPVVTCKGTTFAGRGGASMLGAVGLPDLVATDLATYEALALRLANEPERLADARRRLEIQRTTEALFDIDRFRRHIEAAYVRMVELRRSGAAPRSFAVEANGETKVAPQ